ncbi:MAG: hypothetical protein GF421_04435 [Candidatus Aminicenantes bacterium]|nr:hypothetical protein [Candidatus Aminicenantes bacterium]
MKKPYKPIGLLGSITRDVISFSSGKVNKGLGGVLYPASVLCGLQKNVCLMTNMAEDLASDVFRMVQCWPTMQLSEIKRVSGPGNRVHLFYPEQGERQEVLKSAVPPLKPERIINRLPGLDFLVLLMISGLDITLKNWNKIKKKAKCPLWMDVHSLALSPELGQIRKYTSIENWPEWVSGVDYVQANQKEAASMMGHPERNPDEEELSFFGQSVLKQGVKAVFITLGEKGILVISPEGNRMMRSDENSDVVDTTGCGDVFCGAAASVLAEGRKVTDAVRFGLKLASRAAGRAGIQDTYQMAQEFLKS